MSSWKDYCDDYTVISMKLKIIFFYLSETELCFDWRAFLKEKYSWGSEVRSRYILNQGEN